MIIDETQTRRNNLINILVFVVFFSLTYLGFKYFKETEKSELELMAEEYSKELPMTVNKTTRLDSVAVHENAIFYSYTLVNLNKDDFQIDFIQNDLKSKMIADLQNNSETQKFRDNGVVFNYNYYDKNGVLGTTVEIRPEDVPFVVNN
ncbi:hypothetical protein NBRC110019_20690 [Neptunitalea chrysea]|uniref:Uncharacterized protein n=1 Tax=Neptunitalea chrysea TaxID=1647581 RepID=A0A9W6EUU7_9FLAO|nr:hypothetical protein [Neptunitalea chrysea]GLB53029.1 hypothetical protein NBRC110019_20690 [Neptunitalea chrysea]